MTINQQTQQQLKTIIERVERLEEEKAAIANDIKEVYSEAKSNGFDAKALRKVVKIRKEDADKRKEEEAILETYLHALGMLEGAPLADFAASQFEVSAGRREHSRQLEEV